MGQGHRIPRGLADAGRAAPPYAAGKTTRCTAAGVRYLPAAPFHPIRIGREGLHAPATVVNIRAPAQRAGVLGV
ncbi:Hypothetical protein I596_1896 [Dokdonella koreensis DS-123]|uniref:Uncharacterized protein n=1 Tax=Dokdonella koreensis DS-123 TaxID=1300342 RepID=A0A160DU21_9GAMM|nr:Hypothetical protein I596_1896 [Dokdonella koreensis DS-123]